MSTENPVRLAPIGTKETEEAKEVREWMEQESEWMEQESREIQKLHAALCESRGWRELGCCALIGPGDAMMWKHKDGRVWPRNKAIKHELSATVKGNVPAPIGATPASNGISGDELRTALVKATGSLGLLMSTSGNRAPGHVENYENAKRILAASWPSEYDKFDETPASHGKAQHYCQELFNHMSEAHGLTLIQDEMNQILNICHRIEKQCERFDGEPAQEPSAPAVEALPIGATDATERDLRGAAKDLLSAIRNGATPNDIRGYDHEVNAMAELLARYVVPKLCPPPREAQRAQGDSKLRLALLWFNEKKVEELAFLYGERSAEHLRVILEAASLSPTALPPKDAGADAEEKIS